MKEKTLPKIVKKRIEISKLFYPLTRNEERKWARIFHKGLDSLFVRLKPEASKLDFTQDLVKIILSFGKILVPTQMNVFFVSSLTLHPLRVFKL